jgi:hypothetical protein
MPLGWSVSRPIDAFDVTQRDFPFHSIDPDDETFEALDRGLPPNLRELSCPTLH